MPETISAEQAARIAAKYGLTLADAAVLRDMAKDAADAERLAQVAAGVDQLTAEDVAALSPDELVAAHDAGRLHDYETGTGVCAPVEDVPEGQLGTAALRAMKPEEVMAAKRAGKLDWVLRLQPPTGQLSREQIAELSHDELLRAKASGRTDWAEGRRERFEPGAQT